METKDLSVETLTEVINQLPHSEHRVPYTYHHDYLRQYCDRFKGFARSDVSYATKHETDVQRYSTALVQLIEEHGSDIFTYLLYADDFLVCRQAKTVVNQLVAEYNSVD